MQRHLGYVMTGDLWRVGATPQARLQLLDFRYNVLPSKV